MFDLCEFRLQTPQGQVDCCELPDSVPEGQGEWGGGGGGVGAMRRDRLTAVSYQTVYFWWGGGGYTVVILPFVFKAVS